MSGLDWESFNNTCRAGRLLLASEVDTAIDGMVSAIFEARDEDQAVVGFTNEDFYY